MEQSTATNNQGTSEPAGTAAPTTQPASNSGGSVTGIVMAFVFGSLAIAGVYFGSKEYLVYSILRSKDKAKKPSDFFDNISRAEALLRKCTAMELYKVNQLFNSPEYLEGKPESQWAPATQQLAQIVAKDIFSKRGKELAASSPAFSATISTKDGMLLYDIVADGRSIQNGRQNLSTIGEGEKGFSRWGDIVAVTVKKEGYIELILKNTSGKILARSGSVKI